MKTRTRSIVVLALALAAFLAAVSIAEAHVLSASTAKRGSNAVARDFAQNFAEQGDQDVRYATQKCSRRTAHRFVCRFFVAGVDANGEYICRGFAVVRFVSSSSNRVTAKATSSRLPCAR